MFDPALLYRKHLTSQPVDFSTPTPLLIGHWVGHWVASYPGHIPCMGLGTRLPIGHETLGISVPGAWTVGYSRVFIFHTVTPSRLLAAVTQNLCNSSRCIKNRSVMVKVSLPHFEGEFNYFMFQGEPVLVYCIISNDSYTLSLRTFPRDKKTVIYIL